MDFGYGPKTHRWGSTVFHVQVYNISEVLQSLIEPLTCYENYQTFKQVFYARQMVCLNVQQ